MSAHQPIARVSATCRYQLGYTIGRVSVERDYADLSAAQAAFARVQQRERGNRDAHGGIYDRETRSYVANWRGGTPIARAASSAAEIFAKLIARAQNGTGAPVSIITPRGVADFEHLERNGR